MSKTLSILAACIDHEGYAALLASTARSPKLPPVSPDHFLFSKASVNGHPLDRGEKEEAAEHRRQQLASIRQRIVEVLGCEKTALVLFDVFDKRVRRSEIANLLGIHRCLVTREIQDLKRFIKQKWPSVNGS
jgi:hypothetical protein